MAIPELKSEPNGPAGQFAYIAAILPLYDMFYLIAKYPRTLIQPKAIRRSSVSVLDFHPDTTGSRGGEVKC